MIRLGWILILLIIANFTFFLTLSASAKPMPAKAIEGNQTVSTFSSAKKLISKVYKKLGEKTFYCGCKYTEKTIEAKSCGYTPRMTHTKKGKVNTRAHRVEWEHIVPAHAFGQSFDGWRNKSDHSECKGKSSRSCARKVHAEFRMMEADLYNLVPAIGELNADRSNKSMAMLSGESRNYGSCDFEVDSTKVEPTDSIRGDVARVYMYMDAAYPGRGVISKKNHKLFESWSKSDPVSQEELARAKLIMEIQKNCNPFVMHCTNKSNILPSSH